MNARRILAAMALCAVLVACGDRDAPGRKASADGGTEALPSPEGAARGSVTGMPDKPGPGQVGPPQPAVEPLLDEQGNPIVLPPEGAAPADPSVAEAAPPDGSMPAEPNPQDAVAVVRDYYAAINRRDFARAHALWGDGGRASGQTLQQFADGFADTTGVSVEILAPGEVDAGAGQRHIEVPVALTATHADGRQQRFVGAYTLSRTVVDGATTEQRAWHIASADLREVAP